jgi:signal transduction histidine kinase
LLSDSALWIAAAVLAAWIIWSVENHAAVAIGLAIYHKIGFAAALARLRLGKPVDYGLVVIAWCFLAVLLVVFQKLTGAWSALLIFFPALLARQVLVRSDSLVHTQHELARQRRIASALSERIAAERRDERLRVAGDLHDEVIQPLYQVSLLSHVTSRDLSSGRMGELGADLEQLGKSTDIALSALRTVVHGLRVSPLGPRGLAAALTALAADLEQQSGTRIRCVAVGLEELDVSLELVVYQIAREALTNATFHSRATAIDVTIERDDNGVALTVQDDGVGFNPSIAKDGHFGLLIMEERGYSAGGSVFVDSTIGRGTVVTAYFPA